jgi:hypothetical protein
LVNVSMIAPSDFRSTGPREFALRSPAASENYLVTSFTGCLAQAYHKTLPSLNLKMEMALRAGGSPFEIIAGAPAVRYGARVTFRPADDPRGLAAAFGFESHPWGVPSWIGVRVSPRDVAEIKAYHRLERLDDRFPLPPGFSDHLYPLAASLHNNKTEIYLRQKTSSTWESFVDHALAPFGGGEYPFELRPSTRPDSFGLSVCWVDARPNAVSLYAFSGALPDDFLIERKWVEGMSNTDRTAYANALVAARSLGRMRRGKRHGLLAWTYDLGAGWHRAASLKIVPTEIQLHTHRIS